LTVYLSQVLLTKLRENSSRITVVGLSPEEKTLTLHTAKAIRNEYSPYACSVKLVGKTNTKAIVKNWRWMAGWHRVMFYGNWREQLEDLATLLGLRVVEEDADQSCRG
jgi:hypothetical protein